MLSRHSLMRSNHVWQNWGAASLMHRRLPRAPGHNCSPTVKRPPLIRHLWIILLPVSTPTAPLLRMKILTTAWLQTQMQTQMRTRSRKLEVANLLRSCQRDWPLCLHRWRSQNPPPAPSLALRSAIRLIGRSREFLTELANALASRMKSFPASQMMLGRICMKSA